MLPYKFYFYHRLLGEAEKWVHLALEKSADQGDFDKDWQNISEKDTCWQDAEGPERIYLYSMKALAFLRMKQGDLVTPKSVLQKLKVLDPGDQVG